MNSDIICKEVVEPITYTYNRKFWTIHNIDDLKHGWDCWYRSESFGLLDNRWCFRFNPFAYHGKDDEKFWLNVGIEKLTNNCTLKADIIRLGVVRNDLELSKTLEAKDISNYVSFLVPMEFVEEEESCYFLPVGNLRLFFSLEIRGEDSKAYPYQEITGNRYSKNVSEIACIDAFAQTEEETGVWKLQQELRETLLNGNVSDVVLKFEDREFRAHRCILAARSPVFSAMLIHDTKEKNTGVVDIQDVDSDTFTDFLNYLYTGCIESVTSQNVVSIYTAADKYQVCELKTACIDYMLKNISVDNFCDVLALSLYHLESDLTNSCTEFFIKNSLSIVLTPKWQIFMRENPVAANELYIKQLQMNK